MFPIASASASVPFVMASAAAGTSPAFTMLMLLPPPIGLVLSFRPIVGLFAVVLVPTSFAPSGLVEAIDVHFMPLLLEFV